MREDDLKYFSEFLREFQAETDRGAALVGAALIDDRLVRLLKAHFLECKESEDLLKGGSAPLGAFSARIKMAYCLGLITDLEYKECDYIRRIRNEFAHKVHGLTFKDNKVHDLCQNLKANTPDGARFDGDARQLFINSVILTSLALWYRPDYNKPHKAKQHVWEYQLSP
ncbi:MltR family transcriptional regulator [Alcanivorax sp.]|uniref:MltR family transcriptional regulator n=1 Tax=Alcanivorax sp. TaxID=1872427 RepID=UPI002B2654A3|nr:MltR family transcriptional regulator [Alcanivorax sp.]